MMPSRSKFELWVVLGPPPPVAMLARLMFAVVVELTWNCANFGLTGLVLAAACYGYALPRCCKAN